MILLYSRRSISGVRTQEDSPPPPWTSIGVRVSHVGMVIRAGAGSIRGSLTPVPGIVDFRNASLVSSAISTCGQSFRGFVVGAVVLADGLWLWL